jgi:tetratricopeptide (TPR) repeat protein
MMNSKRAFQRRMVSVILISAVLAGAGSLAVIGLVRSNEARNQAHVAGAKLAEVERQAKMEGDRARRAREQAEELLGFVFSELRDRLDTIGRTDLLESAAQRALGYYDNLPPELRTLEGEQRRADLLEEIAIVQYQQGRLEESETSHRRALGVREDVCARAPANDEWQWRRARGWHELTYTLNAAGKSGEAEEASARCRELCEARTGTPDAKWLRTLASAHFSHGEAARNRREFGVALERYAAALPPAEAAMNLSPKDASVLRTAATLYNNMGVACLSLDRLDEAEKWCRKNVELERRIRQLEPDVRQWNKELATALNNLASILRKRKDYDGALALFEEALVLRRGLVEWDPGNTRWLSSLNTSWHNLAHLRLDRGEFAEAREALRKSIATCLRGMALQPDDPGPVGDLETLRSMSFRYFPQKERTEDLLAEWRAAEAEFATAAQRSKKNGAAAFLDELRAMMRRHGGNDAASLLQSLAQSLTGFSAVPDEADIARIGWDFVRAGAASGEAAFLELARLIGSALAGGAKPQIAEALQNQAARKLVRAEQVIVARDAIWKYFAAAAPPADRASVEFDDTAWPSGAAPLGFGDGDEATRIELPAARMTVYFRHRFSVSDPAALRDFRLALERDDGAIVWLNGRELCRSGMPEGAVLPDTAAILTVKDEMEESAALWFFPQLNLVAGENILAVEVHQNEIQSSDLRLALELAAGISALPAPDLSAIGPAEKALGAPLPPGLVEWLRGGSKPPPR